MNRLLGVVAGVDDDAIAGFIDALDFRDLFHGVEKMAHKVVWQTVANVGEMLLRDDERMHGHLGFKVVERNNLVVLVYYAGIQEFRQRQFCRIRSRSYAMLPFSRNARIERVLCTLV